MLGGVNKEHSIWFIEGPTHFGTTKEIIDILCKRMMKTHTGPIPDERSY